MEGIHLFCLIRTFKFQSKQFIDKNKISTKSVEWGMSKVILSRWISNAHTHKLM